MTSEGSPIDVTSHVLGEIGLGLESAGGDVVITGRDPVFDSPLQFGSMASAALMAKSIAAAAIWRDRTGQSQDLTLDLRRTPRRLCPFYEKKWELLDGVPIGAPADLDDPFMPHHIYRTADDRRILLVNVYDRLRAGALRFLGCDNQVASIAKAVGTWNAVQLETAMNDMGLQATVVRSQEEFNSTHQGKRLAKQPLISVHKIAEGKPIPYSEHPTAPLTGIKALGMGRVIAGGGIGRTLAYHGADALNIWRPTERELDLVYCSAHVGLRSSRLNIDESEGLKRLKALLSGADIFFSNRRSSFLERYGLDPVCSSKNHSGLIHCTISLFGLTGPWRSRIGFDQNAGAATGVFACEGTLEAPALPAIYVVNDYVAAWLSAAGCMAALRLRAKFGGSYRVHVSLARVAQWLLSLGRVSPEVRSRLKDEDGNRSAHKRPILFTSATPLGTYQGVTDQVEFSKTPGGFETVLVPLGASPATWLAPPTI